MHANPKKNIEEQAINIRLCNKDMAEIVSNILNLYIDNIG